ncbi:MAG: 4Fe-4S binding protein [Solirubrobacterales bacterium]
MSKKGIAAASVVLVVLAVILGGILKLDLAVSFSLGVLGAVVTFFLLTGEKPQNVRWVMLFSWGLVFAALIVTSNVMVHGFFICPSKIPLVGEAAGTIPKIEHTDAAKGILPCFFGMFQNYLSSFLTEGFSVSVISLSITILGGIFFLWLAITLVLGRSWCGWICPFGAISDGLSRIPKEPRWKIDLTKNAKYMRYGVFLGIMLLFLAAKAAPTFDYCIVCPFKGVYHSPTYFSDIFAVPSEFITYALFIGFFLVIPILVGKRLWCSAVCPMGTLTSLVGSYSLLTTRIDRENCVNCRKCVDKCKMSAIRLDDKTVKLSASTCGNCGDCMAVCSKDAIKWQIRGTDIEIGQVFIPVIIVILITVAVLLTAVMWKPVLTGLAGLF